MQTAKTTTPDVVGELRNLYEFREPEEVEAYLDRHPNLVDLLVEAAARIPEFIPPDAPIVLEVVWDPEEEDEEGELFAMIPTHRSWEEIRPRMNRLRRDWLIAAARNAAGRFNIGVEYR